MNFGQKDGASQGPPLQAEKGGKSAMPPACPRSA